MSDPATYESASDSMRSRFYTEWVDWITNGEPVDIRDSGGTRQTPIVLKQAGTGQSYVPEIFWHNVETDFPIDHSKHCVRFSDVMLGSGQSAFRSGNTGCRKAKYTTNGFIIIQIFFAKAAFAGDHRRLSVIARDIFRPRNLVNNPVWYKNAYFADMSPTDKFFRTDVFVDYQYDELI